MESGGIDDLRDRVLLALAQKRVTGMSFLGHFLELEWPEVAAPKLAQTMPPAPPFTNAEGRTSLSAILVMIDIGLASVCRLQAGPGVRLATVQLHLQFTGAAPRGCLSLDAISDGQSTGRALRQAFAHGTIHAGVVPVCYGRASFVVLPAPAGYLHGSFPWDFPGDRTPALSEDALDPRERAVLEACERAFGLGSGDGRVFLDRLIGNAPEAEAGGARMAIEVGPTLSNRVGDVQGGMLLAMVAATASTAVPGHPGLSNLSSSFVGAGRGESLNVVSRVLHAGRSLATVRTEVRTPGGALVLDAVSSHAA
jgi:acyl-coenzyme A thioesterase PaaI-like protein